MFVVHKPGKARKFHATSNGLYAMRVEELIKEPETTGRNTLFLQTVEENKKGYSKRAIQKAKKAKELYGMIQYPVYLP